MECSAYRETLDLAPAIESDDPYFEEALKHAGNCEVCHDKLAKRLEIERSIKLTMDTMCHVPENLVSSILHMTREIKPERPKRRLWLATAASFILIITLSTSGWSYWDNYKREEAMEKLCVLSIRNHELSHTPEFLSDNKSHISNWLSVRLSRLVRFPEVIGIDKVIGASRSALGTHIVSAVQFEIDGKRSSLYSYYPDQFGIQNAVTPPKFEMGYSVAVWNEKGVGYSLVSEAKVEKVKMLFNSSFWN
ncbi:hypothetical protein MNBD_NITROSPINAE02-144 [hydrothermal vent metagenome]|uniref:Uncharacterized protein n=1 Tax=hydrothermal vent metagenome TaxID=652676 RepID=A0A3B1CV37_9ZZZZ